MDLALLFVPYLAMANVLTFAAYGVDKLRAIHGEYRIAESTLLTLGFVGGSPGGWFAQRFFKHKTHQRGFQSRFRYIVQVQLATAVVTGAALVMPSLAH
jgi:uncharacterized membrane protein YsdA (DUF1294 family)